VIPVQAVIELNRKMVQDWETVPVGSEVIVTKDDGSEVRTKTRSGPELMGGHSAVIWLEGVSGCYHLKRVRKA
jgi:hypothetical protein